MQLTVDMSLYPLDAEYVPVITGFIDRLNANDGLTIVTNAMSTQVRGDFDVVMSVISKEMKTTFADETKVVMVCKFINGALGIDKEVSW